MWKKISSVFEMFVFFLSFITVVDSPETKTGSKAPVQPGFGLQVFSVRFFITVGLRFAR